MGHGTLTDTVQHTNAQQPEIAPSDISTYLSSIVLDVVSQQCKYVTLWLLPLGIPTSL
jgi:hypothetical protein